jgi:hypothetical protein
MRGFWKVPEGVRVTAEGSWTVGGLPIRHQPSLRVLKSQLRFEDEGAFLLDGKVRLPVQIEGPPFEVSSLRLDRRSGEARILLDDGSEEPLSEVEMDRDTGRFVCRVRGGKARAVLSRAAHQTLLENVEQEGGHFYVAVGKSRLALRP